MTMMTTMTTTMERRYMTSLSSSSMTTTTKEASGIERVVSPETETETITTARRRRQRRRATTSEVKSATQLFPQKAATATTTPSSCRFSKLLLLLLLLNNNKNNNNNVESFTSTKSSSRRRRPTTAAGNIGGIIRDSDQCCCCFHHRRHHQNHHSRKSMQLRLLLNEEGLDDDDDGDNNNNDGSSSEVECGSDHDGGLLIDSISCSSSGLQQFWKKLWTRTTTATTIVVLASSTLLLLGTISINPYNPTSTVAVAVAADDIVIMPAAVGSSSSSSSSSSVLSTTPTSSISMMSSPSSSSSSYTSRPSIIQGQRYWSIMKTQPETPNSNNARDREDDDSDDDDDVAGGRSPSSAGRAKTMMASSDLPPQYLEQQRMTRLEANKALIDYAVGTINTQYYDNSGGAWFNPTDFYNQWRTLRRAVDATTTTTTTSTATSMTPKFVSSSSSGFHMATSTAAASSSTTNHVIRKEQIPDGVLALDTREGTVNALKWLVGNLQDPYSKYMTREELQDERTGNSDGFLGIGAYVGVPSPSSSSSTSVDKYSHSPSSSSLIPPQTSTTIASLTRPKSLLSRSRVDNLPVVKAIVPNSPAERAGLVVGDRIVAVGDRDFLGWTREEVSKILSTRYSQTKNSYVGVADLTIAKPVSAFEEVSSATFVIDEQDTSRSPILSPSLPKEIVLGYRSFRVHIPSRLSEQTFSTIDPAQTSSGRKGNAIVQYELLSSSTGSIFDHMHSADSDPDEYKVGYIRLTRFSKASTAGYLEAVRALEDAGAQSYIIDLRNNYGGVIQEAMMTASTLLRDPHAILCWTLNARGGFVPHDVEEYAVDPRYPGYLLSKDPETSTLDQLLREQPQLFVRNDGSRRGSIMSRSVDVKHALADGILASNWDPPSSFASIHENVVKRGIRRISTVNDVEQQSQNQQRVGESSLSRTQFRLRNDLSSKAKYDQEKLNRKEIVVLINEGTASASEFFTAAMQDNGRSVSVVGTRSYGKGLIQHTFPMPDGGGLKLTIGEYLRPSLRHVTQVGGARFDPTSGELVGGVKPDVFCDSRQGIPSHPSSDLCVGVALDILEENASPVPSSSSSSSSQLMGKNVGK